jgi:hypothetical protein
MGSGNATLCSSGGDLIPASSLVLDESAPQTEPTTKKVIRQTRQAWILKCIRSSNYRERIICPFKRSATELTTTLSENVAEIHCSLWLLERRARQPNADRLSGKTG